MSGAKPLSPFWNGEHKAAGCTFVCSKRIKRNGKRCFRYFIFRCCHFIFVLESGHMSILIQCLLQSRLTCQDFLFLSQSDSIYTNYLFLRMIHPQKKLSSDLKLYEDNKSALPLFCLCFFQLIIFTWFSTFEAYLDGESYR